MLRLSGSVVASFAAALVPTMVLGVALVVLALPSSGFAEPPSPPPALTVTAVDVAADRDMAQVCFRFSAPLDRSLRQDQGRHVAAGPAPASADWAVVVRDQALCLEGLPHGQETTVLLRRGLPGSDGRALAADQLHVVAVPERPPALAFRGPGALLSRLGVEGLSLRTVNLPRVSLKVVRMADRTAVEQLYVGKMGQNLGDSDVAATAERAGKELWHGDITPGGDRTRPQVTAVPMDALPAPLPSGLYLAIAQAEDPRPIPGERVPNADAARVSRGDARPSPPILRAIQWFVVSDLGLTSFLSDDGLLVFARSLARAESLAGVALHLLARNGAPLAQATADADGLARFPAAQLQGEGENAPHALFAYAGADDFAFLDLATASVATPGSDLSDRGAAGRPGPGAREALLVPERGVYRPGDAVNLTVLARGAEGRAEGSRPLELRFWRPDGLEFSRQALALVMAGGASARFDLPAAAPMGRWSVTAHDLPDGPPLGRTVFQVDAVTPPRLDVTLTPAAAVAAVTATAADIFPATVQVEGRYRFGAPAADLSGEASLSFRPAATPFPGLATAFPGFRLGLATARPLPPPQDLPAFTTDEAGRAVLTLPALPVPEASRPLEAVLRTTLHDIGGRPHSRELVLPLPAPPVTLGLRPRFEGDRVPEGATVAFEVLALAAAGTPLARAGLSYELIEEEEDFRWFENAGRWEYERIARDRRTTGGSFATPDNGPAVVEMAVAAGRYRLEVFDPASGAAASLHFSAGWWMAGPGPDRADTVEVAVMKPAHRVGETARIHIHPPYDSQVLVVVADRHIRTTLLKHFPAQGAFLDLPVDPAWSGGVHVVATAFAPETPARNGPGTSAVPRRAIGAGWLGIDPTPRLLDVALAVPATAEPRQTITVELSARTVSPVPEESGPVHVTLAAVDEALLAGPEGIADPVAQLLGRRQLAMELRDIQGRLLSPAPAPVPPAFPEPALSPGSYLSALFSGPLTLPLGGSLRIPLTMPDSAARLRLVALAWTGDRVGRAEASLVLKERLEVAWDGPRWLTPGDQAQVAVTLSGFSGDWRGTWSADLPLTLTEGALSLTGLRKNRPLRLARTITAAPGLPGSGIVRLSLSGPDGQSLQRAWAVEVRAPMPRQSRFTAQLLPRNTPPPALSPLLQALTQGWTEEGRSLAVGLLSRPDLGQAAALLTPVPPQAGAAATAARLLLLAGGHEVLRELRPAGDGPAPEQEVATRLAHLAALQRSDGAFPRWNSGGAADPDGTTLVVEALFRLRKNGFAVSEALQRRALDWLRREAERPLPEPDSATPVSPATLETQAAALLALAGGRMIEAEAVHALRDRSAGALSPLAQTRLAAALARLEPAPPAPTSLPDLSPALAALPLGDAAPLLALAAEHGLQTPERLRAQAAAMMVRVVATPSASPITRAWLATAACALRPVSDAPPRPSFIPVKDETSATLAPAPAAASDEERWLTLVATGTPRDLPPAGGEGCTLTRTLLETDGRPADPNAIRRHDLLVVLLEGKCSGTPAAAGSPEEALVIADSLSAGFVRENVRLEGPTLAGELSWLGTLSPTLHLDARVDRFRAILSPPARETPLRLAYLIRATTPGTFLRPGSHLHRTPPTAWARTAPEQEKILPQEE